MTRADLENCLLEEAHGILNREIGRDEDLHDHFNINKLLLFIQAVHGRLGLELDVNSFFLWPSIGELSHAVEQRIHHQIPKLLTLREGDPAQPLVIFAGGLSCFLELKSLLEGLNHEGVVYGVRLSRFDRPVSNPATVEDEIEACCKELAERRITGPLSLIGYSLGGIFALELARRLQAGGATIRFLGVIDPLHSEHTWPWPVWIRYVSSRILRRIQRMRSAVMATPKSPAAEGQLPAPKQRRSLAHQLRPVLFRFCNPSWEVYPELAPEWCDGHTPAYEQAGRQLLRMKGLYRPRLYHGRLVYYRAEGGTPIFRDQRRIWSDYLPDAEWVDVRGTHLSVIVGRNGMELGRDISRRIRAQSDASEVA